MSARWERLWPVGFAALVLVGVWAALSGGALLPDALATPKLAGVLWLWVTSLWPAALVVLASWGPGWWVLRGLRLESQPVVTQIIMGLAAMTLGWYVLAWLVGLWVWLAWLWVLAGGGAGVWAWRRAGEVTRPTTLKAWQWLWIAPGVGVMLAACVLPTGTLWRTEAFGYDVLSYHLQTVREWWSAGAMVELEHNVYGYLPGLMESAYAWAVGLRGGDVVSSTYTCQLLHATLALLAALQLASIVQRFCQKHDGRGMSGWVAALLLALPWVLITGTLAYNEMAVLAFAAAALHLTLMRDALGQQRGIAIGLLVGAATLAKLTAGLFIALPLGLMLLAYWGGTSFRQRLITSLCAACVGLCVLSPYLLRNTAWTGNPVFPFATGALGQAHWDDFNVDRWGRAHGLSADETASHGLLDTLDRQWLRNTGYGAVGGTPTPREARNIARFDREAGLPVLLLLSLLGCVAGLTHRASRAVTLTMLAWLAYQLAVWWVTTHHQSRFLLPTVLPTVLLAAFAWVAVSRCGVSLVRTAGLTALSCAWAALWGVQVTTMWQQTQRAVDTQSGERVAVPPWFWADTLGDPDRPGFVNHHAINTLPRDAKVLLVADTASLLYIDRPIVYATAFDEDPLGRRLRAVDGERERLVVSLRNEGVTHVWVGWSELDRLHNTYGFDADVTTDRVRQLVRNWPVVMDAGAATLFAVPPVR